MDPNTPYVLTLSVKSVRLTDKQFFLLCRDNPELRLELTAGKELIIMPPTGPKTGWRNSKLTQRLANWAEADGTGLTFDSSTGFTLPNGAKRSPDAAWVRRERWEALSEEEQEEFAPLCPDFVIELRSPRDSLATLQSKMSEYIENGAKLGWLIDPRNKRVYIYRPGQPAEVLESPNSLDGESVLPGFVMNLVDIW
jgi:Uma2 family endonuclease